MWSERELKVFLVGRVGIETNGVRMDEERFPGRQGRLLFACLVAEKGRPVPRDELAEALWGESPPATWEKALTVLVSKLRGLLAECGLDGAEILTSAFGCYRLNLPEGAWVDVVAAADALRDAEAALAADDPERAKSAATRAASLARPPLMPGEEGAWVEEKRRELTDVLHRALSCLAEACLRSGDEAKAAKWAEETIALEPYRETGYRRLMTAHSAAGNRAEALRVYERCRRVLAAELGAYPSPETESMYRELLGARPAEPRARARAPVPEATPGLRLSRRSRVAAFALTLLLAAATVAAVLATRGEGSPEATVAANAVGLIDADGNRIRDQVVVGDAPTNVAFGAGAVWVTSASAHTVSRIDLETHSVRQEIAVGSSPSGIVVGGGGVWVANHDEGTVSWINPQSNTVVKEIRVGNGPTAVAFGHGSVWVTNSDDRTVSRIDAVTGEVVDTIGTGALGRGIAVGPGSVWVTDESTGTVARIDPATNRVTNKETVGSAPAGIVYGDAALWVANELDGTVSKLDPTTLAVRAAIPVAGSPSALAFRDGRLWVSAEFGRRVVRIDTSTGKESAVLRVGNRPKGLAAVPGGVWVAVQASGTGHRGGRLVVTGDRFDSIDPGLAGFNEMRLAYDGLTAFRRVGGSEGTQLLANLAAALPTPTDGGRAYTFRVRAGIRYSDGSLLRAQDFKRALERMYVLGSPLLEGFTALAKVVGASKCLRGRPCDLSRGLIVSGPNLLTVRLSEPDSRLLFDLTMLVPVPDRTPPHDVGTRPIPSTGPYTIESYVPGRQLRLARNSHFRSWSKQARPDGYPDEIAWRIGVHPNEAVRQVIDGKADLLLTVPADRVRDLAARYPRRLHLVWQRATAFVFLNTERAPFDDIRVRQALNYAVDRRKMAELHGGPSVAQPTCQTVPPTVPGYRRYCPYTADPESSGEWKAPDFAKARELVAASGTKGERIVVWTFPFFEKEGTYFVSLLRRLGYRVQLKVLEDLQTYFATLNRTPSAQAGLVGWFGVQVAADLFGTLRCHSSGNWAQFCDSRFDGQVQRLAAEQTSDFAGGAALAARLDRQIVDQAPWVPLFTPRFADFASKRVGNYQTSTYPSNSVMLDQIWVR